MQLDAFLGNPLFTGAMRTALEGGRLPHALLLAAPAGCGRGYAARLLAADYLYPGSAMAQNVVAGQSPELLVVTGEGKSGQIPVDAIRAVRQSVFYSSLSAGGRAVWIKDAHKMTSAAANALLKVLEEPPPGVLFLLTAEDASSLPLTIVSRCALYSLSPLPLAECERILAGQLAPGQSKTLPPLLAAAYGGRLGLGLRALQNPQRLDVLQDALAAVKAAAAGGTYALLRIFSAYEGRQDADRDNRGYLLADMSAILQAALEGGAEGRLPLHSPATATALLPPVQECQTALRGNASPKIAFSALAAQLARAHRGAPLGA